MFCSFVCYSISYAQSDAEKRQSLQYIRTLDYGKVSPQEFNITDLKEKNEGGLYYHHRGVTIRFNRDDNYKTISMSANYLERALVLREIPFEQQTHIINVKRGYTNETIDSLEIRLYDNVDSYSVLDQQYIRTIEIDSLQGDIVEYDISSAKPGQIIEVYYKKTRTNIEEVPHFYFTSHAPTAISYINIYSPDYLRYRAIPIHIDKNEFIYDERELFPKHELFFLPQPKPLFHQTWYMTNLNPISKEVLAPQVHHYHSGIKLILSEIGTPRQPLELDWNIMIAHISRFF